METLVELFHEEPIVTFAVLLAVILIVPPAFERIRLPGIVGLLAAGIVLGQNGLGLLDNESEMMILLSDIGLLYLMFVAGLEIDIQQFKRVKYRAAGFGSFTFLVPLLGGILVGRLFGFEWVSAVLLGSLLASHTLLAYPIISRLGLAGNESVVVTVGATIFTDIGSLVVLAICVGISGGDFTPLKLGGLLLSLVIYTAVVLFGLNWLGKEFFRRSGEEEGNQFLFVLLAVFVASLGAELIGVEKIIGAFLVGLAVNEAVGEGPAKEKIVFVGSVLFIPIFFVNIGLLIDLPAFVSSAEALWVALAITSVLLISKLGAAFISQLLYGYSRDEMLTMWGLSIPQVAATLAAALVANRAGLIESYVLNSVVIMMLVTAIVSPLVVRRFAARLPLPEPEMAALDADDRWRPSENHLFTVVVPIANPNTEQYLIGMAALLAQQTEGQVSPLVITKGHVHMDAPAVERGLGRSEALLEKAVAVSQALAVKADPLLRIDDNIAQGIVRASREQKASLLLMGWGQTSPLRSRLFGSIIDSVLWSAHCPVAVTRLKMAPAEIRQILVTVKNLSGSEVRKLRFAQLLATAVGAELTLLHVGNRRYARQHEKLIGSRLETVFPDEAERQRLSLKFVHDNGDIVRTILRAAEPFDLVILRSYRYRTRGGGLRIGDLTNQLIRKLSCSFVMLSEPQRR